MNCPFCLEDPLDTGPCSCKYKCRNNDTFIEFYNDNIYILIYKKSNTVDFYKKNNFIITLPFNDDLNHVISISNKLNNLMLFT